VNQAGLAATYYWEAWKVDAHSSVAEPKADKTTLNTWSTSLWRMGTAVERIYRDNFQWDPEFRDPPDEGAHPGHVAVSGTLGASMRIDRPNTRYHVDWGLTNDLYGWVEMRAGPGRAKIAKGEVVHDGTAFFVETNQLPDGMRKFDIKNFDPYNLTGAGVLPTIRVDKTTESYLEGYLEKNIENGRIAQPIIHYSRATWNVKKEFGLTKVQTLFGHTIPWNQRTGLS
jgi:hypothetical protein